MREAAAGPGTGGRGVAQEPGVALLPHHLGRWGPWGQWCPWYRAATTAPARVAPARVAVGCGVIGCAAAGCAASGCAASGCAAPVAVAAELDAVGPGIQSHRALFLGLLRLAPRRPLLPLRSLLLLVIRVPGPRFQRLVPAILRPPVWLLVFHLTRRWHTGQARLQLG